MKAIKEIISFVIELVIVFGFTLAVTNVLVPDGTWMSTVEGSSMEPTLEDGQRIFADSDQITHGDIVTAYFPDIVIEKDPEKEDVSIVKRVIGMPGDTVEITTDGIYINGSLIQEDYLPQENKDATYIENGHNSVTLDEDEYYIVGDNRGNSYDSRWFGAIEESDLISKQSETLTTNFIVKTIMMLAAMGVGFGVYRVLEKLFEKIIR